MRSEVQPSEEIRKEIPQLWEKGLEGEGSVLPGLLGRGMRLVVQELLEAEVREFLGRDYYERREVEAPHRGYRNGDERGRIETAEGEVDIRVPQVWDTQEPFASRLRSFLGGHTDVLDRLAAEMYARGLSTRDVEDALFEATGDRLLSRSSVSAVTEVLWREYEEFVGGDLSGYDVVYLFADAIYERVRKQFGVKEAVLVGWGVCRDGRKVLLHLALGNKESRASWVEFFEDMRKGGLPIPLVVTSDGNPGLVGAIEEVFPLSLRARCGYHRMQNLEAKVPSQVWPELKGEIRLIRDAANYEDGRTRLEAFVEKYGAEYPSLCKCLREDPAVLNHLRVSVRHRKTVRTTNLVERSFEEERRRTKVIPGFLTEKSALKLIFSVMIKVARRWNRVPMNKLELVQLET